ncbi:ankyrin-1, partial [Dactylonectria macrodidyma]
MEPIGLAVGIAGLAGLFSSCLEAVDMIHTYLSFGADSQVLDTRFRAAKVRLEKWGRCRPVFQQWLDNDFTAGPKLLWINGPAGFGKTILCAHIVKHVSSTLDTPVAHFFFSSGLESRDDAFIALRSWTAQVVSQNEAAFAHVRQKWDADPVPIVSRANVITIFKDLLHLVPGCTLIVDGLDECTYLDNHSTSVTRFIDTVIGAVVGTDARVLVVSRAEPEIRHALTTQADGAFTEYEIWHDDVQPDTATYARNIVDRKLPNKSDDIRSTLAVIMNDRCEGQFIWLKMQEKSLRKGMNKQQLEKSIKETPTGLNQLYDQTWQRITQYPEWERQRTHALLRWAAFAVRPLTVGEVTEAVLIDGFQDAIVENLPDAIDDDYIDSEIVNLCGSLLEVRGQQLETSASLQTVHLTHFSVKQYLLYNLPTPGLMEENESLWDGYHNALLAKSCLHYISFQRIW